MQVQTRQGGGHFEDAVGRSISGRPFESMAGVMSFPSTPHLPPILPIRIDASIQGEWRLFPWLVARDFMSENSQKRSIMQPHVAVPWAGLNPKNPMIQEAHDYP